MKKIALMFAAVATVALAVPASAQTVVIKEGGMHRHHEGWHRARAEWRHRDWHPHHRGPAIVIKR
jgi:Ni/Co efflux regulator RcnB